MMETGFTLEQWELILGLVVLIGGFIFLVTRGHPEPKDEPDEHDIHKGI